LDHQATSQTQQSSTNQLIKILSLPVGVIVEFKPILLDGQENGE